MAYLLQLERSIVRPRVARYAAITMNTPDETKLRSPLLLDKNRSILVVIDVQEKLMPHIKSRDVITWNLQRLLTAAELFQIPIRASEQYPRGLGATVEPLRQHLNNAIGAPLTEKSMFSCRECEQWLAEATCLERPQIVITGIETHVCVLQSAFDFMAAGFDVFLVVDAVGSRYRLDHRTALTRISQSGGNLITTESVLFEWCERSGTPEFKQVSELVKQPRPRRGRKYDESASANRLQ